MNFDNNVYAGDNDSEMFSEELYFKIYKRLSDDKLSSFLISIYRDDPSIMFEDIISDTFLKIRNKELFLEDIGEIYLKDYRKEITKNQHAGLYENTAVYENEEQLEEKVLDEIPYKYKKMIEDIDFDEEEFSILLYLFDKTVIKKYDYDFAKRKDKRGIDYMILSKMYGKILFKVLKKLKGSGDGNNL